MKKNTFISSISNILSLLKVISKINKKRIFCGILEQLLVNSQNIFWTVVCLKFIINCIINNKPFHYILLYFIIFLIFFLLSDIFLSWYSISMKPISNIEIQTELEEKIFNKINNLDAYCYDNNNFFQKYIFITKNIQNKMLSIIDNFSEIIGSIFMCIIVATVMTLMNTKSLIIIIIPLISTFFLQNKLNQQLFKYLNKFSSCDKKIAYINRCFSLKEYSLEMRTTKIHNVLYKKRNEVSNEINKIIKYNGIKISLTNFTNDLFRNRIPYSTVLIYAVYCATISKEINISEISVMLLGLVNLSDTINIVTNSIMTLLDNSRYINYYNDFLNIKPKISTCKSNTNFTEFKNEIIIESLNFKYENNEKFALRNINMKIKKGQKVAILGLNGSGKTTLIKLLLRMYDPISGSISIDGINIKEYNLEEYKKHFSILMQNFKLFNLSIGENILCKEITNNDKFKINNALNFSNLKNKLKNKKNYIHMPLSKELDDNGLILSGGESQKLAISRAYAKEADIFIFDEPTSAIDPIAENNMLKKISNFPSNKTVIYILHRLSFARNADNIFVLKDGKIIEEGNHETLMNIKGEYANMYNKQSENYKAGVQINE